MLCYAAVTLLTQHNGFLVGQQKFNLFENELNQMEILYQLYRCILYIIKSHLTSFQMNKFKFITTNNVDLVSLVYFVYVVFRITK